MGNRQNIAPNGDVSPMPRPARARVILKQRMIHFFVSCGIEIFYGGQFREEERGKGKEENHPCPKIDDELLFERDPEASSG